jgi:Ribosomal protein S14
LEWQKSLQSLSKKTRANGKNKWEKREQLKKVIYDMNKSVEERLTAVDTLNKMPKNSSPVRLRNRCQLTGRARGYLRKFKLSRLCFREMANQGLIPGIVKASW